MRGTTPGPRWGLASCADSPRPTRSARRVAAALIADRAIGAPAASGRTFTSWVLVVLLWLTMFVGPVAAKPALRLAFLPQASPQPHPSICRVIVPERNATSFGSGTLVGVRENYGLVVTNWHVVRDAAGPIQVAFPGGFRTGARVIRTDKDWDLAALAIWRPDLEPVRIATRPAQRGERLKIAGYGSGSYREATGRCTQYVAPGEKFPFEMLELSAQARQGDSGGPILNDQGELAGVLFGAGRGVTAGSYAGRVQSFLSAVWPEPGQPEGDVIAAQPVAPTPVGDPATDLAANARLPDRPQARPPTWESDEPPASQTAQTLAAVPPPTDEPRPRAAARRTAEFNPGLPRTPRETASNAAPLHWQDLAGTTTLQQVKTILAAIGLLAVVVRVLRFSK